jgi:predicted metal-dependent hydrolase
VSDKQKIENLFNEGLQFYRSGDYFEAHESWEDLWSDYYLEDRKFIQGLIQLSVSFVHLENNNLKGAKSLLNKCKEKFMDFNNVQRGIDINKLLVELDLVGKYYDELNSESQFNWKLVPKI